MSEVKDCLKVLIENGTKKSSICILHCSSNYPTLMKDVNLKAMNTIKDKLKVRVGYSDHTIGSEVAVSAVTLGASVIEKHFTLNKELPGPDHKASLNPEELNKFIQSIRNTEKALGASVKKPNPSELKNKLAVRKSIVASKKINKNEIFTENNIITKRPGSGISPMMWDKIIGRKAKQNFQENDIIII